MGTTCWGNSEKKEAGGEKDGLRLHCPFTKQVRCTHFCEGEFLDSETVSTLCYCISTVKLQKTTWVVLTLQQ